MLKLSHTMRLKALTIWLQKHYFEIFLITIFLDGLLWTSIVPVWHAPDEAAHFANVQDIAETGQMHPAKGDHSRELLMSERLLGTERMKMGRNKFTLHPEYRLQYSSGVNGIYESEIRNFPRSWRTDFVKFESTNYPPLYYLFGAAAYRLGYDSDIFTRVFLVRIVSILTLVVSAFFVFKAGELLFDNNKVIALALSTVVAFQPMMMFTSAGVTSDSLANFLFVVFLYLGLLIIKDGLTVGKIFWLAVVGGLGSQTKPQFILLLPFMAAFLLVDFLKNKRKLDRILANGMFLGVTFLLFGGFIHIKEILGRSKEAVTLVPYVEAPKAGIALASSISLPAFIIWTVKHTVAEVLPWYWGVFDWLGVTLPRTVNQIINRVLIIALVGLVIKVLLVIKSRRWSKQYSMLLFLGSFAIIYFSIITLWDWQHFRSIGFSIGVQGRYFLPAILSHMTFILIGILAFFPTKFKPLGAYLLSIGMVALNLVAVWVVSKTYYDTSSWTVFFNQASQYKSFLIKSPVLPFLLIASVVATSTFLYSFYLNLNIKR